MVILSFVSVFAVVKQGKWSSSLQEELSYIVSDFRKAGFSDNTINSVLEQQYHMLDKLGVSYERIKY